MVQLLVMHADLRTYWLMTLLVYIPDDCGTILIISAFSGRNSSLVVCWARSPASCNVVGSILLWGEFFGRGDFSLGVNMGSDSIPQNSFGLEYKARSSLCSYAFHRRNSKNPDVHVRHQKHPQHAPSTKTECDYLNGWIKKKNHIRKNLTQNGEPQRSSWRRRRRFMLLLTLSRWLDEWTGGRTSGRVDERTDGWMDGCLDGRTDGRMGIWMDGRTDRWVI